jgi:serine/threonine-protein kinase
MNFLTSLQADRIISQIREEADPTSASAKQAFTKLTKLGSSAIPKILEALASADKRQTVEYVEVLNSLINDKTLHLVTRGLADSDPRTIAGTAWALSGNKRYNVNRLVDLLGEDDYSKASIIEVLTAHKDRLNIRQLLGQIYHLQPSEKAAVFKLVDEATTDEMVPDLLSRMDGKDPLVKMHLINVLARFQRPDVNKALQEQLRDPNKLVRQAALLGLARSKANVDVQLVASLLLDPDLEVMNKAIEVVIQLNHPETAKFLIPALKSENEFSRRAAVEILNEVGTTHSIKYLLEAVADEDWWVRSRASDALARIGGPRVVSAVIELIRDKDENIRRAAIEILNTCRDKRAVDQLIEATRDNDWWVSERAADALAEIGDVKALPAILAMITKNNRSLPVALAAAGKLGDQKLLDRILPYLQRPEKEVRVAAIGAVAQLAGDAQAEAVRPHIQQAAQGAEDTVIRAATKALQKLDGRLSPSGRYTGTATTGGATAVASPTPTPSTSTRAASTRAAPPPTTASTSTARTLLVEGPEDTAAARRRPKASARRPTGGDIIEDAMPIPKTARAPGTVAGQDGRRGAPVSSFTNVSDGNQRRLASCASRRITHKNVIRIYDFLYVGGSYAISMEYFPSHTLGAEISNEKPMRPSKAVGYAMDICIGMSVAHQQGIIHRDLKPANILINDGGLLKIVDFGVAAAAKSGDTQLTKTGYVIGSPKYMAPEQILGKKVDERADIYSLGVIMYEMLAGNPPYSRGDHMSVMYQHVQGKAQPLHEANPDIPPALAEVVTKAMQVEKAKRYGSMEELRAALEIAAAPIK